MGTVHLSFLSLAPSMFSTFHGLCHLTDVVVGERCEASRVGTPGDHKPPTPEVLEGKQESKKGF